MDALVPIRAAGGVVWRPTARPGNARGVRHRAGVDREVVLVHRPRHDDWTLPKGKLEPDESALVAAVREVWEETAIRPMVGVRLPTVQYEVWAKGGNGDAPGLQDKYVDYWAMRVALEDTFTPGRETDVRVWLGLDEARARLSYPHDMKVLAAFSELPVLRDPVILLRHGSAGSRSRYDGADTVRPLDTKGLRRAQDLVTTLRCFVPGRLVSASPRRCAETLWPIARALDLPVETQPVLDDGADAQAAAHCLQELADTGRSVVVCSQGKLIPAALAVLSGRPEQTYRTAKGAGWVISFSDKGLVAIDELPV